MDRRRARTRPPRATWPGGLAALCVLAATHGARAELHAARQRPAATDDYACRGPAAVVETNGQCGDDGRRCRWRLPAPADVGHLYALWRHTRPDALWGRPGLVGVVLGAAEGYARLYPGEALVVGDLDAPGPRHASHRAGVDVDLYLPGVMREENAGGGHYEANYEGLPDLSVRARRTRVEDLARLLAVCAGGAVRIFYNDPPVRERFLRWFEGRGLIARLGEPMARHNRLHRFHFHVSVAPDVPAPPSVEPRDARSSWPDTPNRRASSDTTSRQETAR